jgi:hypothetical protein
MAFEVENMDDAFPNCRAFNPHRPVADQGVA